MFHLPYIPSGGLCCSCPFYTFLDGVLLQITAKVSVSLFVLFIIHITRVLRLRFLYFFLSLMGFFPVINFFFSLCLLCVVFRVENMIGIEMGGL